MTENNNPPRDPNKIETYGVKIPVGLKDEIVQLITTEDRPAGEVIADMFTQYKASKMIRESDELAAREIQQVDHHHNRIKEILLGLVKSITDQKDQFAANTQELQERHAGVVANLNDQVLQLKSRLQTLEEENKGLKDHTAKTVERNIELEDTHRTFTKTIALLEINVEELRGQVQGYEDLKAEFSARTIENNNLKSEVEKLQTQLEGQLISHNKEVNRLTEVIDNIKVNHKQEVDRLKTEHNREIGQLRTAHQKDLEAVQTQMDLSCQKTIRDLEKEHRAELDKLREKYEDRVEKLLERAGRNKISVFREKSNNQDIEKD